MAQQKNVMELLAQAKDLKAKAKAINQELKQKKIALATEYTSNMTEAQKQEAIQRAETLLQEAKKKATLYRNEYKEKIKTLRTDVATAKEILAFVNHTQKNGLPKVKNQFRIEKNLLSFKREGINDIIIDVSKANWQQTFKAELKKQGINGDNRIADNIVYKAKTLLDSNRAI